MISGQSNLMLDSGRELNVFIPWKKNISSWSYWLGKLIAVESRQKYVLEACEIDQNVIFPTTVFGKFRIKKKERDKSLSCSRLYLLMMLLPVEIFVTDIDLCYGLVLYVPLQPNLSKYSKNQSIKQTTESRWVVFVLHWKCPWKQLHYHQQVLPAA